MQSDYLPRYIIGDLDSITESTRSHYTQKHVPILQVDDQDSTDFDKAVHLAINMEESTDTIIVVGGYNGRFDQTMSNLHVIYKYTLPRRHIYWFDSHTVSTVLSAGSHEIHINPDTEGPICGLVPLGKAVNEISTTGLKWNLSQHTLEMSTFVSTSNEIITSPITVTTSDPILWTHTLSSN